MYNRYVPQSDGSYRRSRLEEQNQPKRQENRQKPPPQPPVREEPCPQPEVHPHKNQQVGGFFKQLLPPDFDSGDLIIVLLLLLLAGDCQEDKTTAMLTLVLYLFM
jgi:hypothetical protein